MKRSAGTHPWTNRNTQPEVGGKRRCLETSSLENQELC